MMEDSNHEIKSAWDQLVLAVQNLIDDDAIVLNGLRAGSDVSKIKKNFEKNVKLISKRIEEFAVFVPSADAEQVTLPFESCEFERAWVEYKEFLFGVYGIVLIPIEEKKRLAKLHRLSSKDEKIALEIIDFLISSRYKTIFKPNILQLSGETPEYENETNFSIKKNTI